MMETLATALYLLIFCFIQAIFVLVIAAIVKLGEVLVSVADGRNDRALDIIHELPITEGE